MRHKIKPNMIIEVTACPKIGRAVHLGAPLINFEIERVEVKAKSRKLTSKWTIELGETFWINRQPEFKYDR